MSCYYVKQPNGLYARFSDVVDTFTHWNMTFDDMVEAFMEMDDLSREEAVDKTVITIANRLRPFERAIEDFIPNNDTVEKFNALLELMGSRLRVEE